MSRAEATLTKVADLVRGGESYAKYEDMYRRDLTEIPSFRLLASRVQGKVVDLGCGIGYLSRLFPDYVGLDETPSPLRTARAHGVQRLVRGALTALPFTDAAFDWAVVYDVAEHLHDLDRAVLEVRRVARRAAFAVVDFTSYYRYFAHDETHVGHLAPRELIAVLERHYPYVESIPTSGIFRAPRFLNRVLAKRFPNEVVCFCGP